MFPEEKKKKYHLIYIFVSDLTLRPSPATKLECASVGAMVTTGGELMALDWVLLNTRGGGARLGVGARGLVAVVEPGEDSRPESRDRLGSGRK